MTEESPLNQAGYALLYEFIRPDGKTVLVVRLTDSSPDDWHTWGDQFALRHPDIGVASETVRAVEFIDERGRDSSVSNG